MIKIRQQQFEKFNKEAIDGFPSRLVQHLIDRNPAVLPRYPKRQQLEIANIMIARARLWGATWEASIALFADLMQTVAPNFDKFPAIRYALENDELEPDHRMLALADKVQRAVWQQAESKRVELCLYTKPELDTSSVLERTRAALPLVLWDYVLSDDESSQLANQAMQNSKQFGISELDDGPLVTAALTTFYGEPPALKNQLWIRDVLVEPESSVRIEMLRFRLMLDFKRRV